MIARIHPWTLMTDNIFFFIGANHNQLSILISLITLFSQKVDLKLMECRQWRHQYLSVCLSVYLSVCVPVSFSSLPHPSVPPLPYPPTPFPHSCTRLCNSTDMKGGLRFSLHRTIFLAGHLVSHFVPRFWFLGSEDRNSTGFDSSKRAWAASNSAVSWD